MYDKYFLNNVLFFGQEDNRESLRDRSRSQVVNRWQFVLDGKNEEGLDQSPCGWYV